MNSFHFYLGISSADIIGIVGGVGGGVLIIVVIGICIAVSALRIDPVAAAPSTAISPYDFYNRPMYLPDYNRQYGPPRQQVILSSC